MRAVVLTVSIAALSMVACSSDPEPSGADDLGGVAEDAGGDVGDSADGGAMDLGVTPDASDEADVSADADVGETPWMPPTPLVAGTAATDALADAPARCGQPAHTWLREPSLGDVTGWGVRRNMNAAVVESLAAQEGLTLPPLLHDVDIWQFAYVTQDRGQLIEATASVAIPRGIDPGEVLGVVVFLHGTSGFSDQCAPSDDIAGQLLAALPATQGYLVVAPDYIGMKGLGEPSPAPSPYLVGQATAIASLDAVRALYKMTDEERQGLVPSTEVAVWGISQGGHAALWTQRLAPFYARELDFVGGVAAVPTADLIGQAELSLASFTNSTPNTAAMLGTGAAWYGADPAGVFVPPYDVNVPTSLLSDCGAGVISAVTEPSDLFTPALLDAVGAGTLGDVMPWGCMLAENSLTVTSIAPLPSDAPVLFMVGEEDDLIIPSVERAAFGELCAQGVPLDYVECAGEGHVSANLSSFGLVFGYLADRFAGLAGGECERTAPRDCSVD